jgi:hypothetical protein
MEKNNDRIIKYLSDLMDSEERAAFQAELNCSAGLKAELEKFAVTLSEMKHGNIDADERYFASLLPKVRAKVEKKSFMARIPGLVYTAPTLVVITLIGLFIFKPNVSKDISSNTLVQEMIKNLDDEKVSQKYLTELELDVNHAYDMSEDNGISQLQDMDEAAKQRILTLYEAPVSEDLLNMQNLSEDELKTIYTKISNKNSY